MLALLRLMSFPKHACANSRAILDIEDLYVCHSDMLFIGTRRWNSAKTS